MSGKKNKKIRKMMKNRTKSASRQGPEPEDHSVPADVAARLLGQIPADLRDRTVGLFQYDPRLQYKPISAALFDVADPWVRAADESGMDNPRYEIFLRFLCTMAVFAWNLKLIENEAVRDDGIDDVLRTMAQRIGNDVEGLTMCNDILVGMLDRAIDLYLDDRREVTSFELVKENGRQKLYAACAMPSSDVPESIRLELASTPPQPASPNSPTPSTLMPAERPAARIVELDVAAKSGASSEAPGSGS